MVLIERPQIMTFEQSETLIMSKIIQVGEYFQLGRMQSRPARPSGT
jgi:hypothetical protein